MTREAKIGMLTGLFVIVLIGVLLSDYLGSGAANNHMAPLPQFGDSYRQRMLDPVAVPGAVRMDTVGDLPKAYAADRDAGRTQVSAPTIPASAGDPGMGAATGNSTEAAVLPVLAVPAGPAALETGKPAVPVIVTPDGTKGQSAIYVAAGDAVPSVGQIVGPGAALVVDSSGTVKPVVAAAPKGDQYTVVKGDTLMKIARKSYKSSGKDDIRRIIAANRTLLKDENTTLIIGEKLLIPAAPAAAVPARSDSALVVKAPGIDSKKTADASRQDTVMVIRPPSVIDTPASAQKDVDTSSVAPKTDQKADQASDIYVVQKGDTLEKIAKKISASGYKAVMDKIVSLNGIKDKDELQIGMKLKVPLKKT